MSRYWYLSRAGQVFGPVTDTQLADSVAKGRVLPTDLLNEVGQPQWAPANTVPGLFPLGADEPVVADLLDEAEPVIADLVEEQPTTRSAQVTCLACFREVTIGIVAGVATAHCPRCRAAIETGETAAVPAHQAAFAQLESPAAFKERMQKKAAAAEAAAARDNAFLGNLLGSINNIIPQ